MIRISGAGLGKSKRILTLVLSSLFILFSPLFAATPHHLKVVTKSQVGINETVTLKVSTETDQNKKITTDSRTLKVKVYFDSTWIDKTIDIQNGEGSLDISFSKVGPVLFEIADQFDPSLRVYQPVTIVNAVKGGSK